MIEKFSDDLTAALNERDEAKAKNDESGELIAAANVDRDNAISDRDRAGAENAALRTQVQALQNQMTATIAQNTALKRKAEEREETIKRIKTALGVNSNDADE